MLPPRIEAAIAMLDSSADLEDVLLALEKVARDYGFEYFSYWVYHPSSLSRTRFAVTNYRKDWREYYAKANLGMHDYTGFAAAASVTPFVWSDIRARHPLSRQQDRVYDESVDAGLRSGGSVPIHGPGAIKASFSVAGPLEEPIFQKLFARHRHVLHLIATYAHEKIVALKLQEVKPTVALTARESEVLIWAAKGKTSWEIGVILGIKAETVKSHLNHARIKLQATNTTHAIAIAIFNGLIAL